MTRPLHSSQEEVANKAGSTSRRRSTEKLPREDGREEGEIQARGQVNGAAGGAESAVLRERNDKDAPRRKTQGGGDPMGKGRRHAERGSPGNSGPPERGAGERTNTRRASHGEGKEEPPIEGKEVAQGVSSPGRQDASP